MSSEFEDWISQNAPASATVEELASKLIAILVSEMGWNDHLKLLEQRPPANVPTLLSSKDFKALLVEGLVALKPVKLHSLLCSANDLLVFKQLLIKNAGEDWLAPIWWETLCEAGRHAASDAGVTEEYTDVRNRAASIAARFAVRWRQS